MKTPRTREEFERNLHLLYRNIKEQKLHLPQNHPDIEESLLRQRYLPNGRIDFLSIDESARLLSNTISQPHENFEKITNLSESSTDENSNETQ